MTGEVHWQEGMFLGPHHLQALQRLVLERVWTVADQVFPYAWGARKLRIATADIENFLFGIQFCDLTFPDGSRLVIPGNAAIAPRDFKAALDDNNGKLEVYVGVPQYRPADANVAFNNEQDRRFTLDEIERVDENTGRNPQPLAVRRLNARIFFEGEDVPQGFQVLRVATIRRGGGMAAIPMVYAEDFPPVLEIETWQPLQSLANDLVAQIEAKKRYLGERLAGRAINFGTGVSADFEALLKLHAVNGFAPMLRQLADTPHLHPYGLYMEMARIVGGLGVFDSEKRVAPDLPLYDHNRPGPCFYQAYREICRLLDKMVPMSFVIRPFIPVPVAGGHSFKTDDRRGVKLEPELMQAAQAFYLGVLTEDSMANVTKQLTSGQLALGGPGEIPQMRTARFPGLPLKPSDRTPNELPVLEKGHYFLIDLADNDLYARFRMLVQAREGFTSSRELIIDSAVKLPYDIRLYVILKEAYRGRVQ